MRFPARTDRRTRSLVRLLLLAWIVLLVMACSGSAAQAPFGGAASAGGAPQAAASAAAAGSIGGSTSGSKAGDGTQGGGNGDPAALVDETKIVRTGSLQITVPDTDKALQGGRDAIRSLGGYIGASEQQRTAGKIVATVTYRIPVARWEDALDAIRRLGEEVGEQTQATEVTGQLVDLDARIRNLKASEIALVGYLEKAPKVSDLLEIQSRLTDTRGEIERLSAQQASLSDQAALGTLTVTMGTEVVAVTEAAAKWDPAMEVDRASATLIRVGQSVASFLIVFAIVWLPILAGLTILTAIGLAIARRLGWRLRGDLPLDPPQPPLPPAPQAPAAPAAQA